MVVGRLGAKLIVAGAVAVRLEIFLQICAAGSKTDRGRIWRIVNIVFLVFETVPLLPAAWDVVLMSINDDAHIVADGLGVLVTIGE